MNDLEALKLLARRPSLFRPARHLLLFSHMRAKTSLLSHLLGSHPEISGYYEMHIGYYSPRSLLKARLLFHSLHPDAPATRLYFDKILHNRHRVHHRLLNASGVRPIFMLRSPVETLSSIMRLYKGRAHDGHLATEEGALGYYLQRLDGLVDLAGALQRDDVLYIDAEALSRDIDAVTRLLSEALGLSVRIPTEYQIMKLSGQVGHGDSSVNILAGKVLSESAIPQSLSLSHGTVLMARQRYSFLRKTLLSIASEKLTFDGFC
ncbi:hypothetical protein SAMN05421721_10137 [Ectothiorhodospira mobilis]|uniref:Sulfotransferase family protein n=1 Tax=Ectothiorhodospira mobilis TaxID=195064 RepID=A0A1I4P7Q6_ECTMO|nr:sulfotransferase [Ectothiorhodospira mobilis]SFM23577.1 hypothetical protein SAMN05421721_10137 [Ectothiorhodospira mobilis]